MRTLLGTQCLVLVLMLTMSAAFAQGGDKKPWSPDQATGAPDTPKPGDSESAWAPLEADKGNEWLKVEYETAVEIKAVRIHESFNPGAIRRVTAFTDDTTESVIWEGEQTVKDAANVFELGAKQNIKSQSIKIYLDTKRIPGWNEIDAVQLIGKDGSEQWALKATASSTYASQLPSIENLAPSVVKTIPQAGDPNVDPALTEISVTFSKDMITRRMWSFSQISNDTFPGRPEGKPIHYLDDNRTCVMPVTLEPNKTYVIWINSPRFSSFKDVQRNSAVPYLLVFKTKP